MAPDWNAAMIRPSQRLEQEARINVSAMLPGASRRHSYLAEWIGVLIRRMQIRRRGQRQRVSLMTVTGPSSLQGSGRGPTLWRSSRHTDRTARSRPGHLWLIHCVNIARHGQLGVSGRSSRPRVKKGARIAAQHEACRWSRGDGRHAICDMRRRCEPGLGTWLA